MVHSSSDPVIFPWQSVLVVVIIVRGVAATVVCVRKQAGAPQTELLPRLSPRIDIDCAEEIKVMYPLPPPTSLSYCRPSCSGLSSSSGSLLRAVRVKWLCDNADHRGCGASRSVGETETLKTVFVLSGFFVIVVLLLLISGSYRIEQPFVSKLIRNYI